MDDELEDVNSLSDSTAARFSNEPELEQLYIPSSPAQARATPTFINDDPYSMSQMEPESPLRPEGLHRQVSRSRQSSRGSLFGVFGINHAAKAASPERGSRSSLRKDSQGSVTASPRSPKGVAEMVRQVEDLRRPTIGSPRMSRKPSFSLDLVRRGSALRPKEDLESPPISPRLLASLGNKKEKSPSRGSMSQTSNQIHGHNMRAWRMHSQLLGKLQHRKGVAEKFPTQHILHYMPPLIQSSIRQFAFDKLQQFFLPACRLWLRKGHRARQVSQKRDLARPSKQWLSTLPLFRPWPDYDQIIGRLILQCYDPGDVIIYEGEQANSGLFFLVSGSVEVVRRKQRVTKQPSRDNEVVMAQLSAPHQFGEFAILTNEPRSATIRAITEVDLWVLRKEDFLELFTDLTDEVKNRVQYAAFEQRKGIMYQAYPMSVDLIRHCALFKNVTEAFLTQLITKLQPYFVPAGDLLCTAGDVATDMFFLRHGKVGVFKMVGQLDDDEALVKKLGPPAVFGEMSLLFSQKRMATIRTLTPCALWLLSKEDFQSVLMMHSGVKEVILKQANEQHHLWMREQANKYTLWVRTIPLLNLIPSNLDPIKYDKLVTDISQALAPKVYSRYAAVASRSSLCDRVIIVTAGRALVRECGKEVAIGECIGFTCLIPHRWQTFVVANENVECLEIRRDDYKVILERNGVLQLMLKYTKSVMNPRAMPEDVVAKVYGCLSKLQTPPLYPINKSSTVVNFAAPPCSVNQKVKIMHTTRSKEHAELAAQRVAERVQREKLKERSKPRPEVSHHRHSKLAIAEALSEDESGDETTAFINDMRRKLNSLPTQPPTRRRKPVSGAKWVMAGCRISTLLEKETPALHRPGTALGKKHPNILCGKVFWSKPIVSTELPNIAPRARSARPPATRGL